MRTRRGSGVRGVREDRRRRVARPASRGAGRPRHAADVGQGARGHVRRARRAAAGRRPAGRLARGAGRAGRLRGQRRPWAGSPLAGRRHLHLRRARAAALRALRDNLARLGLSVAGGPGAVGTSPGDEPGAAGSDAGDAAAAPGEARCRVLAGDVRRVLQADARRASRYTLVFADPPYERYAQLEPALGRLLGPLLAPRAVLVVETAATAAVGSALAGRPSAALRRHTGHVPGRRGRRPTEGAAPDDDEPPE